MYCIFYYFWQFLIMAVGLIFICFGRRARCSSLRLAVGRDIFWSFCNTSVCTGTLYCVLIARTQGPGALKGKDPGQNTNASFQIPVGQNAVRAPAAGMRSCRGCWALNATASMFDNFVWLPRTYIPGGVCSKKAIRTRDM